MALNVNAFEVDKQQTRNVTKIKSVIMEEIETHRWSSPQMGHITGDIAAAALSASLVTPAVAIIDRSVSMISAKIAWLTSAQVTS